MERATTLLPSAASDTSFLFTLMEPNKHALQRHVVVVDVWLTTTQLLPALVEQEGDRIFWGQVVRITTELVPLQTTGTLKPYGQDTFTVYGVPVFAQTVSKVELVTLTTAKS